MNADTTGTLISPQARAFLDSTTTPEHRGYAVETMGRLRALTREAYREGCETARERYTRNIEEISLGGVAVQVIEPRALREGGDCAVLYFFGGGYCLGSPFEDLRISAPLSQQLGCMVFAPHYRLAPEHPYPAAHEDGFAVYRALLDRYAAERLVVVGESAGGNLALSVSLAARAAGLPLPRALALLSPWADLGNAGDSMTSNARRDPTLSMEALLDAAAAYAGTHSLREPLISPVFAHYDAAFPATLITSGTRDLLLSHCVRLATSMRRGGAVVQLNVWEGMWHVFEFYPELPEAQQSLQEIGAFLRERLGIPHA